jgi:hypothetical protein
MMVPCPKCGGDKRIICWNCNGSGEVELGSPDEFCVHEYYDDRVIGRCLTVWKCAICWHEITIDSS